MLWINHKNMNLSLQYIAFPVYSMAHHNTYYHLLLCTYPCMVKQFVTGNTNMLLQSYSYIFWNIENYNFICWKHIVAVTWHGYIFDQCMCKIFSFTYVFLPILYTNYFRTEYLILQVCVKNILYQNEASQYCFLWLQSIKFSQKCILY